MGAQWYFRAVSNLMEAASLATSLVLLVLQLRAYRRHRHISFALVSASTICSLLYLVALQIMGLLTSKAMHTPMWLYVCSVASFLLALLLAVWGTILLFKSYRQLSESTSSGNEV